MSGTRAYRRPKSCYLLRNQATYRFCAHDHDNVKDRYEEHSKSPLNISWEPAQSRSHHHELDLVQVSGCDT